MKSKKQHVLKKINSRNSFALRWARHPEWGGAAASAAYDYGLDWSKTRQSAAYNPGLDRSKPRQSAA